MAAHSSVLAWRIPGTEEPGGLLSMGSHRVRHDWRDLAAAAAAAAGVLDQCVWGTFGSFKSYSKTPSRSLISGSGLYTQTLGRELPALTLLQTMVTVLQRFGAISSLYPFCNGPWVKNGFYRWIFAIDMMLGNTNFKPLWSKMLSQNSILQKMLYSFYYILNFINKNVEICLLIM